jgi:hypothetical protein
MKTASPYGPGSFHNRVTNLATRYMKDDIAAGVVSVVALNGKGVK